MGDHIPTIPPAIARALAWAATAKPWVDPWLVEQEKLRESREGRKLAKKGGKKSTKTARGKQNKQKEEEEDEVKDDQSDIVDSE